MPFRRKTVESVRTTEDLVTRMERRLEIMQTVLMVREPSSTVAADAYDGLRKQVVTSVQERLAHLSQLVQLDAAVTAGADTATLRDLIAGWMESSGLARLTDPGSADFEHVYDLLEDLGGEMVIVEPAFVDVTSGRVIRRGRARRAAPAVEASAAPMTSSAASPPAPSRVDERG